MLCSVVNHAGSGLGTKDVLGETRDVRAVYTTEKIGTARIKRRTAPTKFDV